MADPLRFTYESTPMRVVFGQGAIKNAHEEAAKLGCRGLVLSTPEQQTMGAAMLERLGDAGASLFSEAAMHVPLEIVERAQAQAAAEGVDYLVAIGGGSTTGLAKILALRMGLPILAIPTTFAGSEMTPIWGITENGRKTTGRSPVVRPAAVIYDPDLVRSLPTALAISSGMNAIAHACEALYAADGNPITSLKARECIASLANALPKIVADPDDMAARSQALYGAWLGGAVLGAAAMALHHKLCHTLGGRFNLPHAELHTALLPHAMAYNAPAAPDAMRAIADALGADNAPAGLFDLAKGLGAEMALSRLGMPLGGIKDAIAEAMTAPYPNPRPLEAGALEKLLADACHGNRPRQH